MLQIFFTLFVGAEAGVGARAGAAAAKIKNAVAGAAKTGGSDNTSKGGGKGKL